jgi:hypothetical protein
VERTDDQGIRCLVTFKHEDKVILVKMAEINFEIDGIVGHKVEDGKLKYTVAFTDSQKTESTFSACVNSESKELYEKNLSAEELALRRKKQFRGNLHEYEFIKGSSKGTNVCDV